jgi:hypothetical protein
MMATGSLGTRASLASLVLAGLLLSPCICAQLTPLPSSTGKFTQGEFSAAWLYNRAENKFTFEMTSPAGSWASLGFSNVPNSGHGAVDSVTCFSLDDGVTPVAIDGNSVPAQTTMHRTDGTQDISDVEFSVQGNKQTCRFTRGLRGDGRDDVDFAVSSAGATQDLVHVQYLVWAYGTDPVAVAAGATKKNNTNSISSRNNDEDEDEQSGGRRRRLSARSLRQRQSGSQRSLQQAGEKLESYTFSGHSQTARGSVKVNFGTGLLDGEDGGSKEDGGGGGMIVIHMEIPELTLVGVILGLGFLTAISCYCFIRRRQMRRKSGKEFDLNSAGSRSIDSRNSFVAPPPPSIKGWAHNDNAAITYGNAAPSKGAKATSDTNEKKKKKKKKKTPTAGSDGKVEIVMRRRSQVDYIPPPPRRKKKT